MRRARPELARPDRALSRRARAPRRGAATVEAVIMLPVLGILLVGVLVVHALLVARQAVLVEARRCAWQHAVQGCRGELPAGCVQPSISRSADLEAKSESILEASRSAVSEGAQVFDDVPILGEAIGGLLGEKASAVVSREVQVPGEPEAPATVHGRVSLLCNERPQSVKAIGEAVLCKYLPCGGGR